MRTFIALATAIAIASPAHAQRGFTLEQILSAPFPSGVTSAPGGAGRAAFVSLHEGRRSVYVVDAATGVATRVAHFAEDDGQDLGSVRVAEAGSVVAFVRGQGYNRIRENPNPSSDPAGAEQSVWVSVAGTKRRIGRGWSPVLSKDGALVVYQLDSTLMVASTAATPANPPRALFRARGLNGDPQWSPDGRHVAFASNRDDHSFVGVYDRVGKKILWIAPGVDRDANPRWVDNKQIVFTRHPGGGGRGDVFAPGGGQGFSIMLGDITDRSARELWRSEPGPGGRMRTPTAGASFLVAGNHVVFFTEAGGWQHLYALALDGSMKQPWPLTAGECEVEEPSATADGAWIYFSSNCGDIDRKHIWRVRTAGGAMPEQITRGETVDYAPAVAGSKLLYLSGSAREQIRPRLASLDGTGAAVVKGAPAIPAEFPADKLVEPQAVTFRTADGMEIHGQFFAPAGGGTKAAAVIFMHGGPVRQMLLGWHPRGYYNRAYAFNQYLASQGYAVLSVNYRGGVGYGRAFREAPNRGRQGASEYQDIVAAGKWLQSHPAVDSTKIGLWGGSYGGYLTAYGMAKNPELFKAGVDLHGVHDWNARFSEFSPAATMGQQQADSIMARGRASSPVCCVANIRGALLLIQGDDDRNVAFSETVTLAQMLRGEKKTFELLVFPDEVHDFLRHRNWLAAYKASADFLDRHLRGITPGVVSNASSVP